MIIYKKVENKGDLDDIQRLRFRVFCRERMLEPEEQYPGGRDGDDYDRYSVHLFARLFDLIPIGTIRLIRNNPLGLPVEKFCKEKIPHGERVAEISKLAISKIAVGISGSSQHDVLMGLLKALYQESRKLGVRYWYAILSESVCRLLNRYGIRYKRIEKSAAYSGKGAPCIIEISEMENNVFLRNAATVDNFAGKSHGVPAFPYPGMQKNRREKIVVH